MIEVKTTELEGKALDWAVAKIEGYQCFINHDAFGPGEHEVVYVNGETGDWHHNGNWRASTNWSQGGPLIERHGVEVFCNLSAEQASRFKCATPDWRACMNRGRSKHSYGPTPLIAAMRCLVAAKLGEVVMVPAELVTAAQ